MPKYKKFKTDEKNLFLSGFFSVVFSNAKVQ